MNFLLFTLPAINGSIISGIARNMMRIPSSRYNTANIYPNLFKHYRQPNEFSQQRYSEGFKESNNQYEINESMREIKPLLEPISEKEVIKPASKKIWLVLPDYYDADAELKNEKSELFDPSFGFFYSDIPDLEAFITAKEQFSLEQKTTEPENLETPPQSDLFSNYYTFRSI